MQARGESGRKIIIRPEVPSDSAAVVKVIEQAFGRKDEARLVERLRAEGDAVISLVGVLEDGVVGHVMLSRLTAPFPALALAPISVTPDHQGRGVGSRLVEEALKQARARGWEGVFVLGDPVFYRRFGFRLDLAVGFSSPYAGPHFMALPLGQSLPASSGTIAHAPAFVDLG